MLTSERNFEPNERYCLRAEGRSLPHVRGSDRLNVNEYLLITFDSDKKKKNKKKIKETERTCSRNQKHVTCNHRDQCEGGVDVLF